MSIILLAPNTECAKHFELLARHVRDLGGAVQIVRCFDASEDMLTRECVGKGFALVGVTGTPKEAQVGLRAINCIARRCLNCVVGICLDESGYGFYVEQYDRPDQSRIRLAVLSGALDAFPHARSLVRIGGQKLLAENGEWSGKIASEIAATIIAESGRRVVNA